VGDGLILETTFLIDLERERRRSERGPAHRFLEASPETRLWLAIPTLGELAVGLDAGERSAWESFVAPFGTLDVDLETCWIYGRTFRYLSDNGLLIGSNDLWISAIALSRQLPLVTRNVRHFRRVPGLTVLEY
jgi:predicted nucleic acid-binding protein